MMKTRNTLVLSLLALALILCTVISPALAYFTDQDQATGAIPISLSGKTEIIDDFKDGKKTIAIQNLKGRDVWVRMLVDYGENPYVGISPGAGWEDGGDGYWYYNSPISSSPPNNATSDFIVDISGVPVPIPTENEELPQMEFNVAVLYETTPVQYKENGDPVKPANWKIPLDTGTTGTTGS